MSESVRFGSLSRRVVVAVCHAGVLLAGCSDPRENPASVPLPEASVPTITYHETAAFAGSFPWREPWSPTAHVLVFNGGDGFYAFDADLPDAPARRVASCIVSHAVWSPDGGWILGLHRPDVWTDRLLAIPLSGEGEVEIVSSDGLGSFLWGSSGFIYYWDDERNLQRVSPPQKWWDENPGPHAVTDQYTQQPREREEAWEPTHWPVVFRAHPDEEEIILIPAPEQEIHAYFILDEFIDRRTLLMAVYPLHDSVYDIVVDAAGNVRTTLRHDCTPLPGGLFLYGFSPHSVSADGRYLVGTTVVEDGHIVYESDLQLAYAGSGWAYPIADAPDGSWPYLSREGLLLALRGLDDGLIHVGELEISVSQ